MTFNEYIGNMSLRDKVTHLLAPGIRPERRPNTDPREYVESIFEDKSIKPGMILVFGGEKEAIAKTIEYVSAHSGSPVLAAMDMEPSPTPANGTDFGSQMAISATDDEGIAYEAGYCCAAEGRAAGLNVSFSPVIDILKNRTNPIVGTRSFGDTAERVIRFSLPYINGMQEHGMIATAKHFPGDGVDDRDQHLCPTVNSLSKEEWLESFGKVWKAAIDAGVKAIMPGHICLPSFEKNGEAIPATQSYTLLTELLRGKLGFKGLIVTDALNMGGLAAYSTREAVVGTLKAGADCLLFPNFLGDISEIADMIEEAVKSGEITEQRIDESLFRIYSAKQDIGLFDEPTVKPCSKELKERFEGAAEKVSQNAPAIIRNCKNELPLNIKNIKKVVSVSLDNKNGSFKNPLDDILKKNGIEVINYGEHTENGLVGVRELPKADAIILNFYYSPYWGTNHIRPSGTQMQRVYQYMYQYDAPAIVVSYANPHIAYEFPYAKTVINTFGAPNVGSSLFDIIFGNADAVGVSPVQIDN